MLITRFEEIRMKNDGSCEYFYKKLNDIVNSSFNLSEKISETKIIQKVLISLPERFRITITIIEESKDLDAFKVEELVEFKPRKNRSIAFNIVGKKSMPLLMLRPLWMRR